jgi:hypothetical protein
MLTFSVRKCEGEPLIRRGLQRRWTRQRTTCNSGPSWTASLSAT